MSNIPIRDLVAIVLSAGILAMWVINPFDDDDDEPPRDKSIALNPDGTLPNES